MIVEVPLSQGEVAVVDAADADAVLQFKWSVAVSDRRLAKYAVRTEADGTAVLLHRSLLGLTKGDPRFIDHIDGDGLNNRRSNLRLCTRSQNALNRGKRPPRRGQRSKSRYIGVSHEYGKWVAYADFRGKRTYLGRFTSEIEAAHARDSHVRALHGEFARLNFPEQDGSAALSLCDQR